MFLHQFSRLFKPGKMPERAFRESEWSPQPRFAHRDLGETLPYSSVLRPRISFWMLGGGSLGPVSVKIVASNVRVCSWAVGELRQLRGAAIGLTPL